MTGLDIKVSITSQFLDKFCPLILSILNDNYQVKLSKPQIESKKYLLEYLKRQNSNLSAINVIYKNHQGFSQMEHSIGLLLRNSLADTHYIFYLNFSNSIQTVINGSFYQNEVLKFLGDQAIKFIKDYSINDAKTLNKFKDYVKVIPGGTIKGIYDKPIRHKDIKCIFQSSKEMKKYTSIYYYWDIYSKYEHWGVLTNLIQKENVDILINRQIKSISLILHGIVLATSNIKELFNEININSESEIQGKFALYVKMMGEMGIK